MALGRARRLLAVGGAALGAVAAQPLGAAAAAVAVDSAGATEVEAGDWSDVYWEHELQRRPAHEWYNVSWPQVRHLFDAEASLLHVGCGTSSWPAAMAAEGREAVHLDGSAALVAELRRRQPELRFEVADAKALPFDDNSFDAVAEKGLLDALLLTSLADATQAALEMYRVLRPGGSLVSLTAYGGPGEEGPVLGAAPWATQVYADVLPTESGHGPVGAYVCTKSDGGGARDSLA
uniref:Methyltransferase type 11 domain-containing protein n=1 Tax=Alexandrium monilatum TaxID=311494 RepID=A0A7S4V6L2_9DINO